jgi:hypothetical protein
MKWRDLTEAERMACESLRARYALLTPPERGRLLADAMGFLDANQSPPTLAAVQNAHAAALAEWMRARRAAR